MSERTGPIKLVSLITIASLPLGVIHIILSNPARFQCTVTAVNTYTVMEQHFYTKLMSLEAYGLDGLDTPEQVLDYFSLLSC